MGSVEIKFIPVWFLASRIVTFITWTPLFLCACCFLCHFVALTDCRLNEEMIETLFVCNATNSNPKETTRRSVLPSPIQENRVLDPKKSQNIAILLRALNVTKEEVCEALLEGVCSLQSHN